MVDQLHEILKGQLDNEFFSGGALLMVIGAGMALLRHLPLKLFEFLKRHIITTVDITDHDPAFFWVRHWLSVHPYTVKKAKLLTASTNKKPLSDSVHVERAEKKKDLDQIKIEFSPAPGKHLIRFKGNWILLTRTRKENENATGRVAYHETITLQAFSRKVIKDLIKDAQSTAFPPEEKSVSIMKHNYSDWHLAQKRPPRSHASVILGDQTMDILMEDIHSFIDSKDWYLENGLTYQRGYLLHGSPGNGKSSTVLAIASLLERDVYILDPTSISDIYVSHLMSLLPEHAILLLEDIDCVTSEERQTKNENLTFSGLLNALDGVYAPTGRLLFMTTNHIEKLDPALIRPGRVDLRFEFQNADGDMAARLFNRLLPGNENLAVTFGQLIESKSEEFSMADIQNHLIRCQKDPKLAASTIPNKDGI